jgi:probable rRNA maturation factor
MIVSIQRRRTISRADGAPSTLELRRRVRSMLRHLQLLNAEVSILLTNDDEIQILNRDYRSIDRPTDVLSFSLLEGEGARFAGDALGDLVVSIETAARQAREAKRPLIDELTMLLAHGLLHLLGWDHRTATEDRRMRAQTDVLCVAAGGPPLFALGGVDARGRSRPARQPTKKASPARKSAARKR